MIRQALHCVLATLLTLVLLTACVRYVSDLWIFSFFFSFQAHIGIAALAAALLFLALFRSRYALFLVLLSAVLTGHAFVMQREFLSDPEREIPASATPLRLMSLNVLGNNSDNDESIADMILASGADVVYVLEGRALREQYDRLGQTYPHRIGCGNLTQACDLVILSKRPFVNQRLSTLSDLRRHRFGLVQIDFGGRIVNFAAAHLSKPYFDEYHAMELARIYQNTWNIDESFVLGGDFNSSGLAPDMQEFLRSRKLLAGDREPATWPTVAGRFGIPIDHIYATQDIHIRSVRPVVIEGSNHFGLVADMVLMP